ncbi:CHAP domain-containing protein [Gelidibacter gilvus]|uniref:CHAP domain-containing protein n=2 Tax=Gelidibacter gilvus TaxID=59602 RepID=A0A4Q0XLC7_9FLAO|nr:CHAP domain-containing protein [Gelidibacter gilvus]
MSCKKEQSTSQLILSETQSQEAPKPKKFNAKKVGDTLDVFNDVYVFYNKSMNNVSGRNLTKDGYNLGLKWQCVEFVKRYYYDYLNHKMPNSYGHAKDFFNPALKDNQKNKDRNLVQFTNGSQLKPEVNDLIIFKGNILNSYGHVAIISKVNKNSIEVVQQNVGKDSREDFKLRLKNDKWTVGDSSVLGWLRKTDR